MEFIFKINGTSFCGSVFSSSKVSKTPFSSSSISSYKTSVFFMIPIVSPFSLEVFAMIGFSSSKDGIFTSEPVSTGYFASFKSLTFAM